ncbi:MAG: hypothetical protein LQ352_007218 [Teloschistes flavicans]|nr:MAG: hypothetical protein LQ352_007218 [Teloschistes flavicans]
MSKNSESISRTHPDYPGSGSESEDDLVLGEIRDSNDLANHDRQVLLEEEEREEFLTEKRSGSHRPFFGRKGKNQTPTSTQQRSHKTQKRKHDGGTREAGELLYKMEEGAAKEDTSSQASTSSTEVDKLGLKGAREAHPTKKRSSVLLAAFGVALLFFCFVLIYGTLRVSRLSKSGLNLATLSNGTSDFAPTTILISLDGFRADFLQRGLTPTLNSFVAEGVSPKYMLPSFPSVTFPNHYTLVTGLHPESHGVVGNSFWDPEWNEDFFYTDPTRSMQPKWWADGEPLWVTAEKQNVTTAIHMWPGSEAHIMSLEPTFLDKFNGTEDLTKKVNRILELLDTPEPALEPAVAGRPRLIAAYVPNVDADGHKYGPNSTEIKETIKNVDTMLHDLFNGLEQRNLTRIVNVVVVSDHGMATTSTDRLIQLDDLIDLNLVDRIDGWPLYGLRPKNTADLQGLYDKLLDEAEHNDHFDVYVKETMPERYHFSNNDRIAPLWVIPKTGWAIVHKDDFDVEEAKAKGIVYSPKGLHGYDHEHPLMRSIFIARGPAFPHEPNSRLEIFQNIEVYNIVCDSIGIEPKPNNGTLRLPLKPIGVHSDPSTVTNSGPEDLASATDAPAASPTSKPSEKTGTSKTPIDDEKDNDKESTGKEDTFWTIFKSKLDAAKVWADEMIAKLGGA